MFSNDEFRNIYVALLTEYQTACTNLASVSALLTNRNQELYPDLYNEFTCRFLSLEARTRELSALLSKVFKIWKKGGKSNETENAKK